MVGYRYAPITPRSYLLGRAVSVIEATWKTRNPNDTDSEIPRSLAERVSILES